MSDFFKYLLLATILVFVAMLYFNTPPRGLDCRHSDLSGHGARYIACVDEKGDSITYIMSGLQEEMKK